jgi:hypothetical protein
MPSTLYSSARDSAWVKGPAGSLGEARLGHFWKNNAMTNSAMVEGGGQS